MERSAGVLLHPTCLPSAHGIGDLGPTAHGYLGWLAEAEMTWWQVLPLTPPGPGHAPYSSISTFAGNPWLISPDALVEDGLLSRSDVAAAPGFAVDRVDFRPVMEWKGSLLRRAWESFGRDRRPLAGELDAFRGRHQAWLDDFTLFAALKRNHGDVAYQDWPESLRLRRPAALDAARAGLAEECAFHEFCQFLFFRQWEHLREVARARGIQILGDVPIFVALDSAEVWSRPDLFKLDRAGRPTVVAGVPPDYFSATGQLWGNPVYDWPRHAAEGFDWWIGRLRHILTTVDAVRLDHFRGFAAGWEVPAADPIASGGRWSPGPGRALFDAVRAELGTLPLVAEDLGDITTDVVELRRELGLPGMAILQFGFSPDPRSSFIPYAHERDQVVYTGTHDNNTTMGWYHDEASDGERDLFRRYAQGDGSEPHWDMIRLAMASVAELAIVPHQDLLGLGSEARMNRPGVGDGNWAFRLPAGGLDPEVATRLRDLAQVYGRTPATPDGDDDVHGEDRPLLESDDG
jgi:4-alpha-glucanotransferase